MTKRKDDTKLQLFGWGLTAAVSVIALYAWWLDHNSHLSNLTVYDVFPLLGLMAFSIMWSQYVSGAMSELFEIKGKVLRTYYQYTGYAVLLLILLHPGLLIIQRFLDGYGVPPNSYKSYVEPSMQWLLFLGSASLVIFLTYELKRFFDKKSWWRYVTIAVDISMIAIFYHGLELGGQLSQNNWFRTLWVFYGVVLIVILLHKYVSMIGQYRARRGLSK